MNFGSAIAGTISAIILGTVAASAMPDATTMKRLETVAFYLGAADHCQIDIETDRLRAFYKRNDAFDPITFGALNRYVKLGSIEHHALAARTVA